LNHDFRWLNFFLQTPRQRDDPTDKSPAEEEVKDKHGTEMRLIPGRRSWQKVEHKYQQP
jgi:hypothetical protein